MNGGIYSTGNEIVDENAKLKDIWKYYSAGVVSDNHQRKRKAKSDSHYYTGRYCVLV